ncbi:hypothetical protein OG599_35050 (plasmid) [Streptomyces sp. NBC_01335]|uniref:hypothetical protein n=1 Tax=Streptomyces sp. NBC_01335 TaxID=2903828 RepID=UPI002E14733F|nr:hypothetical protein OG599_35050 [Streptomyces sp. NBC_01335]
MDGTENEGVPAKAYAGALREAVAGYLAAGGTQRAIADAVPVAYSTVSRYLSGDRILNAADLPKLRSFLAEQGHPMDDQAYGRLENLCRAAHAASGSPATQLAQIQIDLARLTEEHSKALTELGDQAARLTELEDQAARLAELEDQGARLSGQLEQALDRIEKQNRKLQHAQDYTRQIEAELADQQEQARLLRGEVDVLREQNRRLIEEQVPAVSTQVSSDEPALATGLRGSPTAGQDGSLHEAGPAQGSLDDTDFYAQLLEGLAVRQHEMRQNPERWTQNLGGIRPPTPHPPSPASWDPVPPDPPRGPANPPLVLAAGPPLVRRYFCILLMTYLSWVLWLTFMVALQADPGPSIVVMALTAVIAFVAPIIGMRLLTGFPGQDGEPVEDDLRSLLVLQAITFVGWCASLMDPFFTFVRADALATWIAHGILL